MALNLQGLYLSKECFNQAGQASVRTSESSSIKRYRLRIGNRSDGGVETGLQVKSLIKDTYIAHSRQDSHIQI